jgi:tetratricopeptide (TPR) repeat protein
MSKKSWWKGRYPFERWNKCPTRPDPVEVIYFYLDRQGIKPERHVDYLMKLLGLHQAMVYRIFKGQGLDSISRCRQLVQALEIYPPLLGIDGEYYPIKRHARWWEACGFPIHADAQGYPAVSEVIAYLRRQKEMTEEGGTVKVWSQSDLGEALKLTKETVYKMENDKNPRILDSMSRRATLALTLGALAEENEVIFRLFGLDPQAYGGSALAPKIQAVHFSTQRLTDEMLKRYHSQQAAFFADYLSHHAQDAVGEARALIEQLEEIIPRASTTAQRVNILALHSRYHRLIHDVAREQRKINLITFHGDKAVKLAEYATSLPELHDKALLRASNELLAEALLARATAYYELGQYDQAQVEIDRGLKLLPTLQSRQLKRHLLIDAGLIHAYAARTWKDREQALYYFKLAADSINPHQPDEPDDNFVQCGKGMLYIRKAMALSVPQMKGVSSIETASEALEQAQNHADPTLTRRLTLIDIFQAQAHIDAGEYEQATKVALTALEKCKQIRSGLNKGRIEGLYRQLLDTSYRDKPLLARLGMRLRTFDHEDES